MVRGGYDGGITRGGRWGVGLAALVCALLLPGLVLINSLGDCAPNVQCHHSFLLAVLGPTVIVGVVVGRIVRFTVNRGWGEH